MKTSYFIITTKVLVLLFLLNTPVWAAPKLQVVTTVAPITNLVKNVGGDLINIKGIDRKSVV